MRAGHFRIETGELADAMLFSDPIDVAVDLLLAAVAVAPVRIALKRKRVHVRLHITGGARVAVVIPGTAHIAALLQQQKIIDASFTQLDGHTQTAEATTNDGHLYATGLHIDPGLTCHRYPPWTAPLSFVIGGYSRHGWRP